MEKVGKKGNGEDTRGARRAHAGEWFDSDRCSDSSLDMAAAASNARIPSDACGPAGSRRSMGSHGFGTTMDE